MLPTITHCYRFATKAAFMPLCALPSANRQTNEQNKKKTHTKPSHSLLGFNACFSDAILYSCVCVVCATDRLCLVEIASFSLCLVCSNSCWQFNSVLGWVPATCAIPSCHTPPNTADSSEKYTVWYVNENASGIHTVLPIPFSAYLALTSFRPHLLTSVILSYYGSIYGFIFNRDTTTLYASISGRANKHKKKIYCVCYQYWGGFLSQPTRTKSNHSLKLVTHQQRNTEKKKNMCVFCDLDGAYQLMSRIGRF